MLGVLGWNDGTEQELFSLAELIEKFSVSRVSKAGAKFDFEKAKWFNHEWIKRTDDVTLLPKIKENIEQHGVDTSTQSETYMLNVLGAVKERLTYVEDFWTQASFFFVTPEQYDVEAVKPKWNEQKTAFFRK